MSERKPVKEYSNEEVTVTWEPEKCIHSAKCVKGLPQVFDTAKRPWITISGASIDSIVSQVKNCPSGALGYYFKESERETVATLAEQRVEVMPNGPLMVYGNLKIKLPNGEQRDQDKVAAFCRCGDSQNKPFCDGSHRTNGFNG